MSPLLISLVVLLVLVVASVYFSHRKKPKRMTDRKLQQPKPVVDKVPEHRYEKPLSPPISFEGLESFKAKPNNLGKIINYDKGHGVRREKINASREFYLINTLCRGQQDVADRLCKSLKAKYPDRSKYWIIEKAIADLERDRQIR